MFWILAPILLTIGAFAWSILAVFANGMSDSPSTPFQGGGLMALLWVAAVVAWAMWLYAR